MGRKAQLNELERADLIATGLAGDFWQKVLKPLLEDRHMAMQAALRNPDLARKHKLPDNYIRGQLDLAELLLSQPRLEMESLQNAAVEEKLVAQREKEDILTAHYGFGWQPSE